MEKQMLLKSCNNADLHQTLTHLHRSINSLTRSSSSSSSHNRRCSRLSVSGSKLRSDLESVKPIVRSSNGNGSVTSLANRLRLGSLTEDGLSYKENFIVRCYEVGINSHPIEIGSQL
ncbi:oleoyl-[acyl-carrier-protein] hydrolase [Ranunculus cassubicifolius]